MPGTNFSPGLGMSSFNCIGLDVALHAVHVALRGKIALGGFGNHVAPNGVAAGHHHAQAVAQLHGVGLRLRQRRVNPGLRQVHDGDNRLSLGHHFALPRRPHIHLAVDGREDLRISFFHLAPPPPARGHWPRRRGSGPPCARRLRLDSSCARAWRRLACAAARFSRAASTAAFAACSAVTSSSRVCWLTIPCCARCHGAAGVGLLVLILRLGLRQRGLGRLSPAPRR